MTDKFDELINNIFSSLVSEEIKPSTIATPIVTRIKTDTDKGEEVPGHETKLVRNLGKLKKFRQKAIPKLAADVGKELSTFKQQLKSRTEGK